MLKLKKSHPNKSLESLVGKKFGRLTVLEKKGNTNWGNAMWLCICAGVS